MKRERNALASLMAVIIALSLAGCGEAQQEAETTAVPTIGVVEETTEETTLPEPTEDPAPAPVIDEEGYWESFTVVESELFENPWEITNNECVELFPAQNPEEYIKIAREYKFRDVDFSFHTTPGTVKLGHVDDLLVAQFEMEDDGILWNMRMDKTDGYENRTGIVLPEEGMYWVDEIDYEDYQVLNYSWQDSCSETEWGFVEIRLCYYPEYGSLYTFYGRYTLDPAIFADGGSFTMHPPDTIIFTKEAKRVNWYKDLQ